ncbi:hypothetical protein HD554DRAFT_2168842 [Boletus coccyginus]|nr:hypothetical protein HD554DRAFT_2168842 [Boletus coccyginus]
MGCVPTLATAVANGYDRHRICHLLSARLTYPYRPPTSGDDRGYGSPPRVYDRGRHSAPALDDRAPSHAHAPPQACRVVDQVLQRQASAGEWRAGSQWHVPRRRSAALGIRPHDEGPAIEEGNTPFVCDDDDVVGGEYCERCGPCKVDEDAYTGCSLAWVSVSEQLFALSLNGYIHHVDVSAKTTLSKWRIHSSNDVGSIALASNGAFLVASANSSVSFWDTTTREQIGTVVEYTHKLWSMVVSSNHDLVACGDRIITLRTLYGILPSDYIDNARRTQESTANLQRTIQEPRAQEEGSNGKITGLTKTVQELRDKLAESQRAANQEKDRFNETINSLRTRDEASSSRIAHLERTNQQLRTQLADAQRKADGLIRINHAHEQKHQCESLFAQGRIQRAAECLLEFANTLNDDVRANKLITDWLAEFTHRCIAALERVGDEASTTGKLDEAIAAYSIVLLLGPSIPNAVLAKWAEMMLSRGSADEASSAATKFKVPRFVVYRVICDILERDGRVTEALKCFRQMQNELPEDAGAHDERSGWELDFKARCMKGLEQNGDIAMDSSSYEGAVAHYSTALTLDPLSVVLLTKRSRARAGIGSWQDSLEDADAAIKLDPSSLFGHERKHAALLGARHYVKAINAYNDMLLILERSPDPVTRELRKDYVSPSQTKETIRSAVKRTQRDAPLVVVNTKTGRLCDQRERMDEFEANPKFVELVASTTTRLDHSRIRQVVQEYFRYATFSHTWEGAEPLFHDVLHGSVHKLAESFTVLKLVMFCTTVREAGFRWAWCDTCCINKTDGSVLQESLTSMFKWYHESSLTLIHFKGILSDSELDGLERSLWNTRAWTLQEFFASLVVRFYTEDWKPYRPDEKVYNHKDSPAIMAEMARATGTDKLCLAATRVATRQEDMAYSLFGIFDVSNPVTYGEGQQRVVGCLLQEVLTRSGDVSILAWTGKALEYNSCLPAEISVYREPASPYVPLPIEDGEMDQLVTGLRKSSKIIEPAMILYDRVIVLPSRQPGDSPQRVYHTTTPPFGNVEIKTVEDLSSLNNLVLVHPWLRCLLDPVLPFEDLMDDDAEPLTPVDGDGGDGNSDALFTNLRPPSPYTAPSPHHTPQLDKLTRALRLFVRLRQPFGALLLVPLSHDEYKRVASDHPIVVRVLRGISPRYLAQNIRTLDIL